MRLQSKYTFSSPKFDETSIVLYETGLLQMSQQRCILEQVFSNVIATGFIVQFVFEHVVPQKRLGKLW